MLFHIFASIGAIIGARADLLPQRPIPERRF